LGLQNRVAPKSEKVTLPIPKLEKQAITEATDLTSVKKFTDDAEDDEVKFVSDGIIDRKLNSINEINDPSKKTQGTLENLEYHDVKVKTNKAKEDGLLASGSKNLPTEGDESKTPNMNSTEELPTIGTEILNKKSIKVFDNVHQKIELDQKRKSDHFG